MIYSILVTTWECHGAGPGFIKENLKKITEIEYRPLQCVISDHSKNDEIENIVKSIDPKGVDVVYVRYPENYGNIALNWSNALKFAQGDIIQYFTMDDWFHNPMAIDRIVTFFKDSPECMWVMVPKIDWPANKMFTPSWTDVNPMRNTIGGPNSIVFRKSLSYVEMDPNLVWFVDTEWYFRLGLAAGPPVLYPIEPLYTCRTHPLQLQHHIENPVKMREHNYIINKYKDLRC
jgi:glycosyltransferase involved in cell wall biosynthesis